MKKILSVIILFCVQAVAAQEAEVRKSIDLFFEGLHSADTLKIQLVCHSKMLFQSIAETGAGAVLSDESPAEFYKSIASIPKGLRLEERLLSYKIQIDGSMAHAWTPYEFYINGKLSHSGTNSFTFINDNGTWKIVHIIDTRKKAPSSKG